tara:strand:- start:425 stop:661 length:237 start_codon:yes stop_codon:yes gene_type:complete
LPDKNKLWHLKWASSIILLVAMTFTAQNMFPFNLYLHVLGTIGWLVVSMVWNDRALIVVNSVALSIFANGILSSWNEV